MSSSIKQKTISNLIWKFSERMLAQIVTTVVSIILARILLPDDYGAVALISAFVNICNVFVVKGFSNALVQKKNADDTDFSTVFYISAAMTGLVYLALFFLAPEIASFYEIPILCPLLRVMGLKIPCAALNSIQHAVVARRLEFKRYFFATLTGTLISAVVGILLAVCGFGAWALVGQYLTNTLVDTLFLWFTVKWRPKLLFSFSRAKGLLSYGWKILASALFDEFCNEIRSFVIGKKYSVADLAYYTKGQQFPNLINTNIDASINSVLFPVLAKTQDHLEMLKRYTRKAIKTSAYIMFPLLLGLCAVAKQFVIVLLSEKWLGAVPFLQIMCVCYLFTPLHSANLQAVKAAGRSDYFLGMNIIKNVVTIVTLVIAVPFGVKWVALSAVISTMISFLVNVWPNKHLLGYGYMEQLRDIVPTLLLATSMAAVVYCVGFMNCNSILLLAIQIAVGVVYYVAMSILTRQEIFRMLKDLLAERFKKKNYYEP